MSRSKTRSNPRLPSAVEATKSNETPRLNLSLGTSAADDYANYVERMKPIIFERYPLIGNFVTTGAYRVPIEPVRPTPQELQSDPLLSGLYISKRNQNDKLLLDMELMKPQAYSFIWGTLSNESKAKLKQRSGFTQMEADMDPLVLWKAIEAAHMVAASGSAVYDRSRARALYHGLKQSAAESLADFKMRTDTALASLKTAGASLPTDQEQATDFIDRLDPNRFSQLFVTLRNNESFGVGKYPTDLTAAYDLASEFMVPVTILRGGVATQHGAAFAVTADRSGARDKKKRNRNRDKGKGGGKAATAQDEDTAGSNNKNDKNNKKKNGAGKAERRPCPPGRSCPICSETGHWPSDCGVLAQAHQAGLFDNLLKKGASGKVAVCRAATSATPEDDEDVIPALEELVIDESAYTITADTLKPPTSTPVGDGADCVQHHADVQSAVIAVSRNDKLRKTDLLLDNQATVSLVHNLGRLSNVRDAEVPLRVTGIGGSLTVTKVGTMQFFGDAYYHRSATANVISFSSAIAAGADIEFVRGSNMFLWNTGKRVFEFRLKDGLYVCNIADCNGASVRVVSTVAENEAQFTKREVQAARMARRLTAQLGYISDADLIKTIQSGAIMNCPVTVQDVQRARAIYGPDIASLKGKTTWKRPPVVRIEQVPRPLQSAQTLHVDIMFVESDPYLVSVSEPLDLTMVTPMISRNQEVILKHLMEHIKGYSARLFEVRVLVSDGEGGIKAIADHLHGLGIVVEGKAPESHDGVVERKIRVLKERARAHLAVLPFALVHYHLCYLVLFCNSRINLMPSRKRTDNLSPREAYLGRKLDFKRDLYEFGAYAQATSPVTIKNSMAPRTEGVIVLLPMGNAEGSVKCFCLKTKRVVTRSSVKVLPMPQEVIDYMNTLAASQKRKVGKDPIFRLRDMELDEPDPEEAPPLALPAARAEPDATVPANEFVPTDLPEVVAAAPDPPMAQQPALIPSQFDHRGADSTNPTDRRGDEIAQAAEIPPQGAPPLLTTDVEDPEPPEPQPQSQPEYPKPVRSKSRTKPARRDATPPPIHGMRLRTNPRKKVFHAYLAHGVYELERVREEYGYNLTSAKALKMFGKKALCSIVAEVLQIDDKGVIAPVLYQTLSRTELKSIIRSSLFLKEKVLPDGQFDKLKSRLVASGNMQDKTVYDDISSPTISTSSAMMIIAIAASERRHVITLDIAGAYLNAPMKEKVVLMRIDPLIAGILAKFRPERYASFLRPDGSMIVKLLKALYGCVESSRLWYDHISTTLIKNGFKKNPLDHCVFNKMYGDKQCTTGIHVDDLLVTCADPKALQDVEKILTDAYKTLTVHRGKVHSYLGMTLDFSVQGKAKITMNGYLEEALKQYKVTGKAATPASDHLFDLRDSDALDSEHREEFHSRVAKLLYVAKRVRPDILTAVAFLATRVTAPTDDDWRKLDRVLRYLNASLNLGIVLEVPDKIQVIVYADASFAVHGDQKSHSGVHISLGRGPIYMKSTKQRLVSKSTTEAELIALSDCATQAIWTRNFLIEQGHDVGPAVIYQDNKSTIGLAEKGTHCSDRTRHINIRFFWTKDRIDAEEIKIQYLPTRDMIADLLTKPLQGALFRALRALLLNWM